MEHKQIELSEKRRMLYELSQTDGWRLVLEPLLKGDTEFVVSLTLSDPEQGQGENQKELRFKIKSLEDQRFAHGKYSEARKILATVVAARKNIEKQ